MLYVQQLPVIIIHLVYCRLHRTYDLRSFGVSRALCQLQKQLRVSCEQFFVLGRQLYCPYMHCGRILEQLAVCQLVPEILLIVAVCGAADGIVFRFVGLDDHAAVS